MQERLIQLKRECLNDGGKALKAIVSSPDLFEANFLVALARKYRGVAIHINFNETLKSKIDKTEWLSVMSLYSWDAALEYEKHPGNLKNQIKLMH